MLTPHSYEEGRRIESILYRECGHINFYGLMSVLIKLADSDNLAKLEAAWPDVVARARDYYNNGVPQPDPQVTHTGAIDMQVCVPKGWTDKQVTEFAEHNNPCGTTSGWQIRREGDPALMDCKERTPCDDRNGAVHIMLDA